MRRAALLLPLAAAALAAAPSGASAAVTCVYHPEDYRLAIAATDAADRPTVARTGSAITVRSGPTPVACSGAAATVTNTDDVVIADKSPGTGMITVDLAGGLLAPGHESEGMYGTREIEISAYGGAGDKDELRVVGSAGADDLRAGEWGVQKQVNLNPGELLDDPDVLISDVEVVTLLGGDGEDRLDAAGGEGSGQPLTTFTHLEGGAGDDRIYAGKKGARLTGDGGDDVVFGGPGRDTLIPGPGDDVVDGAEEEDLLTFPGATSGVVVDLADSDAQQTGEGLDVLANLEDVDGTQGDDVVRGDGGVNHLAGAEGSDRLEGRGGDDVPDGEEGRDEASYESAQSAVTVDLGAPAPQSAGGAGEDELLAIEGLVGSSNDDVLLGDGGANGLDGGQGGDTIEGRGGADVLDGGGSGGGGGDGADHLDGGAGSDTVSYAERVGGVAVVLDGAANDGQDSDGDGVGEEGDQTVAVENAIGGIGQDVLRAPGTGVNRLSGGKGSDVLDGGLGSDTLDGGPNDDTLSYGKRTYRVAVRLDGIRNDGEDPNGDGTSGAGEERDLDIAIENVTGGAGNDRLFGGSGANILKGGPGADVLTGGLGADVLDGGGGTDTMSYALRTAGVAVTLNGLADDGADPNHDGTSTAAEEGDRDIAIENATGGAGQDTLKAKMAAVNVLTGGGGNDSLDAKDGTTRKDTLDCGAGTFDVIVADASDAQAGCEATPVR
ncbi:MAG TPA: calcium-binding protein [Solirubrobacteraceae bacterium]